MFCSVLLFIDEADAFLLQRQKSVMSEDMRSALNAFLYRTGEPSQKFMLVLASNQPHHFDVAVNDRLDDMVEFQLPGSSEREQMLQHYYSEFILETDKTRWSHKRKILVEGIDIKLKLQEYAKVTEGLSGREIAKLALGWQTSVYGSNGRKLTEKMMDDGVYKMMQQHRQKIDWKKD